MNQAINRRVLVVDDQESILEDFRKIFGVDEGSASMRSAREAFFGSDEKEPTLPTFVVTTARQGEEGVQLLREAVAESAPFAAAFVDVRMPPGINGIETVRRLWSHDPNLQVVICTAYSDYSLEDIVTELGHSDRLLVLKKPFDPVEVRQLASALVMKWNAAERVQHQIRDLQEANERAEAASRTKSEFLANMSHEIRTPMNALLGYVELLCDPGVTPEEKERYGEIIKRSGEHLLTILNDILDISRIEASRIMINETEFSPVEVVREVASLLGTQAAEKGIDLLVEFDGPVPGVVDSDHVRVRQILLNLVGNAVKFTEEGSVRISVHMDGYAGARERFLQFDIVDTGPGIAPEDVDLLFEPFSQVDGSTTRRAGGTGLGLAISRRLARMLGGDIEVESTLGVGSSFTLSLRVGEVREASLVLVDPIGAVTPNPPSEDERARALQELRLDGRFLLVEDVRFNQLLMAAILRKAGGVVEVAENGEQACQQVEESLRAGSPYDLVLMDMQMPVLDGYEATRRVRAAGYTGPVLALTAHAMGGDRDRCIEAGCTDYATKPVDRRRLLALCKRLLAEAATPAALPTEGGDPVEDPEREPTRE